MLREISSLTTYPLTSVRRITAQNNSNIHSREQRWARTEGRRGQHRLDCLAYRRQSYWDYPSKSSYRRANLVRSGSLDQETLVLRTVDQIPGRCRLYPLTLAVFSLSSCPSDPSHHHQPPSVASYSFCPLHHDHYMTHQHQSFRQRSQTPLSCCLRKGQG